MCWVWYNGASLCTARDPAFAPSGTPERPNSGGGDYAVMAALGNGRLLSIVTGARSRLPGTPPDHGAHNAAWAAGGDHHPPLPQPGAGNPPSRPAEPRGESSKGAPGEQSPPCGAGRGRTTGSECRPAPSQAVSGCSRALPNSAQQSRGGAGGSAPRHPLHPALRSPGMPTHPPPRRPAPARAWSRSQGLGRAGAARAGRLGAVRVGGGTGRGAPRAPAGRANGRPAFGKIAIYGHVLGPRAPPARARAPLRLNTGGGGRGRSHSPQPAHAPCPLVACLLVFPHPTASSSAGK